MIQILDHLAADYAAVNVLDNPQIREGIKEYSQWPTIPQLYIDREFIGGCDIVKQMFNSGELHRILGAEPPDRSTPKIHVSDGAAAAIQRALKDQPGIAVHLAISAAWNHQFQLGPAQGHELKVKSNGVEILFDLASARRADGLSIDMVETPQGAGFAIHNPGAPPPVNEISPPELKQRLDASEPLHLFDVREVHERERARIPGSRLLDQDTVAFIETLDKHEMLVFYCHHAQRSHSAADYFRQQGYTNVHNLTGGIDAWSQQIDPSVPRY